MFIFILIAGQILSKINAILLIFAFVMVIINSNTNIMKKRNLIIVALCFVAVIAISSCKTHERCPAYGMNIHSQPNITASLAS